LQAGVEDIAITTNATLLKRRLPELLDAGLQRVNISLDAVDETVFKRATGGGSSKPVWEGIDELLSRGLHPVKLNAVVMRGVNDSEVTKLAALTETLPLHVRFIEYMHLNNAASDTYRESFVAGREMRALVEQAFGPLEPVPTDPSAPARLFKVTGWRGAVGFINPVSEPFCGACSRMRLTSDAKLRPCLLNDREFDLRPALQHAEPIAAVQETFLVAAHRKVASGLTAPSQRPRTMVAIGG
jgi:cyclic pyranopterin phosphate synthase